jgi:myosin heavy subunit
VNRVKALPQIFIKAFEAVKNAIKGNADEAKESLKELNQAFIQMQTGLDTEQQKKLVENAKSMAEEMKKEAAAAKALAEAEIRLHDLEIEMIGTVADLTKEREKAKLEAKDDTKTIEERLQAQDRAMAIDKELMEVEIQAAKERARISQERIDLGKSTRDDFRENAELQAEVSRLESAYFTRSKEITTERISLVNQLKAEEKAKTDAVKQALLEEAQSKQEYVNRELEIWELRNQSAIKSGQQLTDSLIEEENERLDMLAEQKMSALDLAYENELISEQEHQLELLKIQDETNKQKLAIDATYEKQRTKIEEEASKIREKLSEQESKAKLDFANIFFGAIADVASEGTMAQKSASSALIAIDTIRGALAAYASMQSLPFPANFIAGGTAAAAVGIRGAKAIKDVWAVSDKGTRTVATQSSSSGVAASAVSSASVTSDGGLVERDLNSRVSVPDNIAKTQQVLVVDQVTQDQKIQSDANVLATV